MEIVRQDCFQTRSRFFHVACGPWYKVLLVVFAMLTSVGWVLLLWYIPFTEKKLPYERGDVRPCRIRNSSPRNLLSNMFHAFVAPR